MTRKFFIATFGCRTNQADSASIRDGLAQSGYVETADAGSADVIVVNSCTVTHRSDQQVRQLTRHFHRENPEARIIVTGCYAQRSPDRLAAIEGVAAVVGNSHKEDLVELISGTSWPGSDGAQSGFPAVFREGFKRDRVLAAAPASRPGGRTVPYVKLQDGCDAKCSYCIIPEVRGPSRSVPPDRVLAQVAQLVEEGFREIVLTGIHIGTYGMHLSPRYPLDRLLEEMLGLPGIGRIRLSSIEPMELSRRIIELAAASDRIAPHFHICLQSGSDRILRQMRRPYTVARFAGILDEIRSRIPHAGIGTDLIVGFPGETDADHRATMEFLEGAPVTYLHVFPYSDRPGTSASSLPDKVPPPVIAERAGEFRQLGRRKEEQFRKTLIGTRQRVITLDRVDDRGREGLTGNYLKAVVPGSLPGNGLFDGPIRRIVRGIVEFGELHEIP